MAKTTEVKRQVRKNFAELQDGTLVEIKNITDPSTYGKDVIVYENKLAKGAKAGQSEYSVSVEDFVPNRRAASDALLVQLTSGTITAQEYADAMVARATARAEKKAEKEVK